MICTRGSHRCSFFLVKVNGAQRTGTSALCVTDSTAMCDTSCVTGHFSSVTNTSNFGWGDRCDCRVSANFHNPQTTPHAVVNQVFVVLCCVVLQSGKFGNATPSEAHESQPQGIQYAEDAAEHENMKAVLKSSLLGDDSGASTVPGHRSRTRASSTRGPSYWHHLLSEPCKELVGLLLSPIYPANVRYL